MRTMPRVFCGAPSRVAYRMYTYLPENRRMGLPSLTNLLLSITNDRDGVGWATTCRAARRAKNTPLCSVMAHTMMICVMWTRWGRCVLGG